MAISYDNRKKSYDSMNDSQKQQYNDLLKNKGDDYIGNQYMKQYNQQMNNTPQSNNNSSNFNNQNGTNWQNQAYKWNPWQLDQKVETTKDANGYSQTELILLQKKNMLTSIKIRIITKIIRLIITIQTRH